MKCITTIVLGLLLTSSLTAKAAYAQTNPSTSPQNSILSSTKSDADVTSSTTRMVLRDANGKQIGEVFKDAEGKLFLIKSPGLTDGLNAVDFSSDVLVVVLLTIVFGGLGGIVFELLNLQGNIEKPHKPTEDELAAKLAYASRKNVIDLGVLARIIIGAAAAPPAMLFLRPESVFGLLAMSVVAGSAGTAVFRSLQERLLLAVAQQGKVEPETPAMKQNTKLDAAIDAFEMLYQKVQKVSERHFETTEISFPRGITFESKEFDDIWEFMVEAKGVNDEVNAKVDDAIKEFLELEKNVKELSESQLGKTQLRIPPTHNARLDFKAFDDVKKFLREAKAISKTLVTREATKVSNSVITSDETTPSRSITFEINSTAEVDEAINAFAELKEKLLKASTRVAGTTTLQFSSSNVLEHKDLDKVQKLLSQLK